MPRCAVVLLLLVAAPLARGESANESAIRALRNDTSLKVRTQAALVLGQRGAAEAVPALREAVARDEAPAVRLAAARPDALAGGPLPYRSTQQLAILAE